MITIGDLTYTSIETITAFDPVTGNYRFTLDELQDATIAQTQDESEVTGKNGRRLATLKRNKAVTVSATNGLVSGGLMEAQTGSSFEHTATIVRWTDYLTVSDNASATNYTAIGSTGAEIVALYIRNTDGTLGSELTQGATAAAGTFTYNPASKALGFADIEDGTEIVVYYDRRIMADVLTNESDTYSDTCALYVDLLAEDKCSNVYRVQYYFPRADVSGEFSLEMSDSQAVHAFEATALAGSCGAAGQFYTYVIFGANAEDAA